MDTTCVSTRDGCRLSGCSSRVARDVPLSLGLWRRSLSPRMEPAAVRVRGKLVCDSSECPIAPPIGGANSVEPIHCDDFPTRVHWSFSSRELCQRCAKPVPLSRGPSRSWPIENPKCDSPCPRSPTPPTIPDLYRRPVWIYVFPRKITKPRELGIVDGHQPSTLASRPSTGNQNYTVSTPFLPVTDNELAYPNPGTKTAPFLHRFLAAKEMKSRISNHLRSSSGSTGAIPPPRAGSQLSTIHSQLHNPGSSASRRPALSTAEMCQGVPNLCRFRGFIVCGSRRSSLDSQFPLPRGEGLRVRDRLLLPFMALSPCPHLYRIFTDLQRRGCCARPFSLGLRRRSLSGAAIIQRPG
jgi:hypothetical protein